MPTFQSYAAYYDLLYQDKPYGREVDFVEALIHKYNPRTKDILDLGCGSGRHAVELYKRGYAVTGYDRSHAMLALAEQRKQELPAPPGARRMEFHQADITDFKPSARFDTAVALFHVVSYLTSYQQLAACLQIINQALGPQGIFIFDFWYGPAVLIDPPTLRIKEFADDQSEILRISEPQLNIARNTVDVHFTMRVDDKHNRQECKKFKETHTMRYWFQPELEHFITQSGFRVCEMGEWLTAQPPSPGTWNAYMVVQKTT